MDIDEYGPSGESATKQIGRNDDTIHAVETSTKMSKIQVIPTHDTA